MGRIAEALKRAQRERAERLDGESADLAEPAGGVRPEPGARARPLDGSSAAVAAPPALTPILEPPPSPKPFPISATPIQPESLDPQVLAFHEPMGEIAEKYRSVRTRLLTANPGGSARAYAVTSTLPREGKTVTVANLGFSLAELRHLRVAMVDLDFRHRGLTSLVGAQDRPGMAEVLRSEKRLSDVCVPVVRENLHFIPVGDPGQAGPSDLLANEAVGQVFREINERFHYCLIDTPPIHAFADIGLIAPLCHSVLIVIRMNVTPEPLLQRCVKMLQANHLSITGCILAGYREDAMSFNTSQDFFTSGP